MVLELERAERVRNLLDRVGLAVREIVHRIDAPVIAGAMMSRMQDAIHDRVAHVEVSGRHVDLGAKHFAAVWELPSRMPSKSSRFSSIDLSRNGLCAPGSVSVPRYSRISSAVRSST